MKKETIDEVKVISFLYLSSGGFLSNFVKDETI